MDSYAENFPLFGEAPGITEILSKIDRLEAKVVNLERIREQIGLLLDALKKM